VTAEERFDEWAVVEVMGHRRLAGRVTEQRLAGADLLRVDIPIHGGEFATQYYGGSSIFCLTPVTEEVARAVACRNTPEPIHRWELPAAVAAVDANDWTQD
jgi:hypothetical protein